MSEGTYSPGPWRVAVCGTSIRIFDCGGREIGRAFHTGPHTGPGSRRSANAGLMAAAPELYQVCRAIESNLGECALPIEVEEALRAALAKAKGEAR